MIRRISRRDVLQRAAAVGVLTAAPRYSAGQGAEPYGHLSADAARTLEAIVARLIPSDASGPGALEAGAARYIDRALGDALAAARDTYVAGLAALDDYARNAAGRAFAELDPERQDALLAGLEQNRATGFAPDSATFFETVLAHTLEGTFGDPYYGGNRDFIGWDLLGYPGLRLAVSPEDQRMAASPQPTRVSAYDLPMFDAEEPGAHGDR